MAVATAGALERPTTPSSSSDDPELKQMWAKLGAEPGGSSAEAFRAMIDEDVAKRGKVVREAKITLG